MSPRPRSACRGQGPGRGGRDPRVRPPLFQARWLGAVRLREPLVLGHEVAGTVVEVGAALTRLSPGARVAVNPSGPCGSCKFCQKGQQNHCLDMRFYGSAMRFPHVQGGFREILTCAAGQAYPVPDHVSLAEAAFAEPLAVALHAVAQAGSVLAAACWSRAPVRSGG